MAQAARERQVKAQEIIEHDPYVKDLIRQYDAKIVPGSIQPT
jgi:DNA polymerase-3 subunit gamma/tau